MTSMNGQGSLLVLSLAAVLATCTACSSLPWAGTSGSGDTVSVEVVRADMAFSVPAVGYLEATKASPIAVPRVPTGALKVKSVMDEGSIVAEGDVVVVFDDTQLNIDLDNQMASFRSTSRRLDRNEVQSVIEDGSIGVMKQVAQLERDNADAFSIEDEMIYSRLEILEQSVRKEEASETIIFADMSLLLRGEYYDIEERILGVERDQVQGNIDRVNTSLGNLVLKAPLGGLIIYKKNWRGSSVQVGDTLWPGNVIMSIVDPASTMLAGFVLEKDGAGVTVGSPATVRVDARPDLAFQGKVKSIAEISRPIERESPVKYTEVQIEIENGDPQLLKPGMKGEAWIEVGQSANAVVIPRSALRGDGDERYVMVEGVEGPEKRPVKAGAGDHVRISIVEGLEEGERVILGGEEPIDPVATAGTEPLPRRGSKRGGRRVPAAVH
jgi:multidrug efflux pump subunit AcrA (membrane-fusion protein)